MVYAEISDTYRYIQKQQNLCKHMHQACKQMQVHSITNMQMYGIICRNMPKI